MNEEMLHQQFNKTSFLRKMDDFGLNLYDNGCESTLRQILRNLAEDKMERYEMNGDEFANIDDGLSSTIINTDKIIAEYPPMTHTQRLQRNEPDFEWNLSDEKTPLLSVSDRKHRKIKTYVNQSLQEATENVNQMILLEAEENQNRKDNYHVVYIVFFLMGISTMLPWNFFIALNNFWNYRFRNVSINSHSDMVNNVNSSHTPPHTELQKEFTSYLSIASNVPNAIVVILNAMYGHLIPVRKRIVYSTAIIIFLFSLITCLSLTDSDAWQTTFLYVILTLVVLVSAHSSILTGSVFGLAGMFPSRYMGAAMVGQAVGGIFPAMAVITILSLNIEEKNVGFSCFLVATAFLCGTLVSFMQVKHSIFFQHYANKVVIPNKGRKNSHNLEWAEEDHLESVRITAKRSVSLQRSMIKCLHYLCAIFLTSFFTLSVFPSLAVLIKPCSSVFYPNWKSNSASSKWSTIYFTPVSVFLLSSVGDSVGRISANVFKIPGPTKYSGAAVLAMSLLRATFIPLFLLCNAVPEQRSTAVVFTYDEIFIVFIALLSISNGYLGNTCMLYGPKLVEEEHVEMQEKIAMVLVAFLVSGQACGSFISYYVLKLL